MPTLTRREFARLLALSLAGTAAAGAAGLPALAGGALAAPAGKPTPGRLDPTLPLHPALQYGAQVEPDKVVRVVLQKVKPDHDGRKLAADAGAAHLEEFAFIKAHHLAIAQGKLPKLALHPHVLHISPDTAVRPTMDTEELRTTYPFTARATSAWNSDSAATRATGLGVTVAVLDTGVNVAAPGLGPNVAARSVLSLPGGDDHGHGTHVAGIINGRDPYNRYLGVAPDATVLGVRVADATGMAHEADLLRGLQWCFDNRAAQNIRVVNVSMGSGTAASYKTSPVSAAVEQLWLNGVVVVVAAGNRAAAADATWYPPANDPYVVTVGALDENGTRSTYDDLLATFSSRGATQDGVAKPDVVAPGRKIVSALASASAALATTYPGRITDGNFIRMSGTSMAAPVVSGIAALLLQRYPNLTPNQVKWLLTTTATAYPNQADKAGAVSAYAALQRAAQGGVGAANQGLAPCNGISPATNTATWGANGYWDQGYWDQAYWDTGYWDTAQNLD